MADEPDDTALDERIESIQRRAENFRELLKEGDEVTITFEDGEMHVEESYRSKFERKHPKLYGRMLSLELQLDAGFFAYLGVLVLASGFIIGLHRGWWDVVIGEGFPAFLLDHWWWPYIALPIVTLYAARQVCARYEKHVYGRQRQALLDLIAAEGLDRDTLVVTLRGNTEVENVVYYLRLDADA
jgi:hypothetical protein